MDISLSPRLRQLLSGSVLLGVLAAPVVVAPLSGPAAAQPAVAAVAAASVAGSSSVTTATSDRTERRGKARSRVASSNVAFDLVNTNNSTVLCLPLPDEGNYRVRGRLVGPRSALNGRDAVITVNVLVHDAGTGGWFFNLRSNPAYDYATQLAKQGQTSLVLDRLGYDRSPLGNGTATCLGAQVHMLHQVVQHLYGGNFDYLGARAGDTALHASHVVLQGHGTGATIAQLTAARFDVVRGLVLMAPATTSPSQLALQAVRGQAQTCLGDTFAPYGSSARDYRRLLFRTAPKAVQQAAVKRRNPTPCGDVASLPGALASMTLADRGVDVPVLVLRGGADARTSGAGSSVTSTKKITRTTIRGAGSALTLERSAPQTRRAVVRWLDTL